MNMAMSSAASAPSSRASTTTGPYSQDPPTKGPFQKSDIRVNIKHHYSNKVYTSSEPIAGDVTITTRRDVRFDSIQIVLVGTTRTKIESNVGSMLPQETSHTFLRLIMPIPASTYPVPRLLEDGRTYTIPFNFVIPNQLTISACNHAMLSGQLQDHHVRLPPTMGAWNRLGKDDMAPHMAHVEYAIKARVFRLPDLNGKRVRIMEAIQPLTLLPASLEDPPLSVTDKDRIYSLSKTKTLKKNVFSKLGRLTARAASQPRAAVVKPDGSGLASTTAAHLHLHFEPNAPNTPPPRITNVTGKITAHTYFSSGAVDSFPNLTRDWAAQFSVDRRGAYSTSTPLRPISVAQPVWKRQQQQQGQEQPGVSRRDSGYASDTGLVPTQNDKKKQKRNSQSSGPPVEQVSYTTDLRIPIDFSLERRAFIPTFHSCIVSRVYAVQLTVTAEGGTSVALVLPVQIMVGELPLSSLLSSAAAAAAAAAAEVVVIGGAVGAAPGGGLPSFEAAVEEAAADAHLRPRVMHVPDAQLLRTSVLPGYQG